MERLAQKMGHGLVERFNLREVYLGLLVVALLSYSWMFRGISVPNERTRVYLAVSLVDHHALSVDGAVHRFGPTTDIAAFDGRLYTDKAPGSSLLGALVYGAARMFTTEDDWSIEALVNLMRTWLMLPVGLLGFFVLRRLLEVMGFTEPIRDIASLGWILGSAAFHYSTAYYGHQIVALSFLVALLLLAQAGQNAEEESPRRLAHFVGAGAAAGVAGITEYQSALPCLLLLAYVVATNYRTPSRIIAFALSAAPFAVLLLAYNRMVFGGMFELSYEHLVVKNIKALHSKGIAGVSVPHAEAVFGSLLSLHRGLLTTSPIFLLVPHGLSLMWRRRERHLALLIGGAFAYYLLFNFSAEVWWAGWGFGPRLIVPVMGWAIIPVAYSIGSITSGSVLGVVKGLVLWGICYHQLVHLVFPEMPEGAVNPVMDLALPALAQGQVSPNLMTQVFGARGSWSIVPALTLAAAAAFRILKAGALPTTPARRALPLLASCAIPLLLTATVVLVGPRWGEKRTRKFVRWMGRLEKTELAATRGAGDSNE